MTKIFYVCEACEEGYSEGCGYVDRNDLRVVGERWLCETCYEEDRDVPHDAPRWSTLKPPPQYVPAKQQ